LINSGESLLRLFQTTPVRRGPDLVSISASAFLIVSSILAGWMRRLTTSRSSADAGDFPSHRVQNRTIYSFRVSSMMWSTPSVFRRSDIAAFAAMIRPLIVARQLSDRNGRS
jgi:hypothetical protein